MVGSSKEAGSFTIQSCQLAEVVLRKPGSPVYRDHPCSAASCYWVDRRIPLSGLVFVGRSGGKRQM